MCIVKYPMYTFCPPFLKQIPTFVSHQRESRLSCTKQNERVTFPSMKTIRPEEIKDNVFSLISKDWMLITAEKEGKVNMMTASWGGLGFIWNKPVATIYIRPTRYTKEFIDSEETFSLNILPKQKKSALDYCGSHSGRTEDKVAATKLTVEHMNGTPWFAESRMVLFCKKLFASS